MRSAALHPNDPYAATTPGSLAVDVLGNVRARCDDQPVTTTRGLQPALLLFFVIHRNGVVSVDLLHETFWPEKTVSNVHTNIKALRRVLEPGRHRDEFEILVSASDGYKLVLADEHLDAWRFEKAVADAQGVMCADPRSARDCLKYALGLWRGNAYHEARAHRFADEEIRHLETLRDATRETLFETEIRCGNAAGMIAEIESFYADPGKADLEPRVKLQAYAAVGQLAKAAAVYEDFCKEHEQEPSDEFTGLYRELLDRQPAGKPLSSFSDAAGRSAIAGYRERVQAQLRHSDIRWVVRAPQSGVMLDAAELFTPLFVDSGPTEVAADVRPLSLEALVARSDRVLLIGASGCGKSTFLEHMGRVSATNPDGPIPLLIRCRDLVGGAWATEAKPDWRSLRAVIEDKLADEALGMKINDLEGLAQAGDVIWLVDALNEVPKVDERTKLANMLSSAAQHWSSCKWVVTTSSTITAESLPLGFEVTEVAEWESDHMRAFLRSLVRLSFPAMGKVQVNERADAILDRVLDHPDPVMRRLGGTPLFLTALAVLDLAGRPPVESRADILESITSWLMEDRMAMLQQSLGNALRADEVLRTLAYNMVSGESGVAAQIGRQAAAQGIEHLFHDCLDAALVFVTQASTGGGLLVPRGVGDVGFSQDLFRDYLAAKHLAGKTDGLGDDGWWSVLGQRLDDPAWRDVLSFVPARLLHLGRERVDLFFERFGESSRSVSFETKTHRVALGGQILRDLRPLGYASASHIPAWHDAVTGVRRLFEVVSDRPDLETKFEAAVAYGREGDPRLLDLDAAWAWLPGGSCLLGAQATDQSVAGFDRDAAPWEAPVRQLPLEPFAIRRFPITVIEYEEFVEDGGYDDLAAELWSSDGWSWKASLKVSEPRDWADQRASPNAPVTGVSWFEAVAFTAWLSEGESSKDLRCQLPGEAQWEFAARRGVPTGQQFPWGNRMTWGPAAEANWAGCFLRHKSPVGMFPKSTTRDGVADLFGNVEEWCRDRWDSAAEPEWRSDPSSGLDHRVVRGGSSIRFSRLCRPSYRSRILANHRYHTVGFRPVLERLAQ
jgi:formylglycine-generating enzyme required for sulfatase activity/DNA-binding SARP family transcriptional activator/energy-coupling factor transporter ATP-binding protein EcfA2